MSWSAVILVLPAAVIAVLDWRKGLLAMIIVALLQDPLRKLELDRPVYFTLLAGVVFAIAYLRAQVNQPFLPRQIPGWRHFLRMPSILLLVLVVAQGVHSVVVYGKPVIAGIGALSYLAPLPALLAGYHFALRRGQKGIEQWLRWYLIVALIVLPGIALEYAGFDWRVLGDVGQGLLLYEDDMILTAHSGFFRASEMAAWHTATVVCVLSLLTSVRRVSMLRMATVVAIIVALLAIGILTGRRKILVEITIFMSIYVALLAYFGKGGVKLAVGAIVGGMLSYALALSLVDESVSPLASQSDVRFQRYAERSAMVGSGVAERFIDLGLEPVEWAVEGFGWLGGGLGVASQGAQHFGGGTEVFGGAGEGGLGKITAELGVPGLAIALWFGFAALRYGWHVLLFLSQRSPSIARLAYGLAALLIANLAVFFVATQLFGDIFVLLLLGMVAGFFLATPVLAEREKALAGRRRDPVLAPQRMAVAGAGWARRAGRR